MTLLSEHARNATAALHQILRSPGDFDSERAAAVEEFVRRRDLDRLVLQQAEGISAGTDLLRTRMIHVPFSKPTRGVRPLNPEAEEIISHPPAAE